eukprot:scaffold12112_cov185-Isochrysis_galbana.AAC.1
MNREGGLCAQEGHRKGLGSSGVYNIMSSRNGASAINGGRRSINGMALGLQWYTRSSCPGQGRALEIVIARYE